MTGDEVRPARQVMAGLPALALDHTQVGSLRHPGVLLTAVGDVEVRALQQGGLPPPGLLQGEGDQVQATALSLAPPETQTAVAPFHRSAAGPVTLVTLQIFHHLHLHHSLH